MVRTLLLFALGMIACCFAYAEEPIRGELIFPLQDKHAHSSSIVECPNGDLLACWYHGSGERSANDVLIQGARRRKDADKWSPVFVMADTPEIPDCNPILFVDAKDRLWLVWTCVLANRWEHGLLKYRRADDFADDGPPHWSWQDIIVLKPGAAFPEQIRAGFDALGFDQGHWGEYAPPYDEMVVEAARQAPKRQRGWMPRTHPTVLPSGRILLPLYSDGFNLSITAISDDVGAATWRASRPIVGLGPIQPSIVRKTNGQLIAYLRDGGGPPQRVQTSTSTDDGESWSASVDTDIPNSSSSLEVIQLASGRWLMVYNDTEHGRASLAAALSDDEGNTWKFNRHIERTKGWSFGYPSVIQDSSGQIHVTYSYGAGKNGEAIKHVEFDESWVMAGEAK